MMQEDNNNNNDAQKESHLDSLAEQPLHVIPAGTTASPARRPRRDVVTFGPTGSTELDSDHQLFSLPAATRNHELMGPILRRKKVLSMPLGAGGECITCYCFRRGPWLILSADMLSIQAIFSVVMSPVLPPKRCNSLTMRPGAIV